MPIGTDLAEIADKELAFLGDKANTYNVFVNGKLTRPAQINI
ncbi:MAG: hypothetical protein Q7S74_01620 [Nanoarchaeota archaeon]|nr:hypothetical protein [Nanoarchaeota archaeon]